MYSSFARELTGWVKGVQEAVSVPCEELTEVVQEDRVEENRTSCERSKRRVSHNCFVCLFLSPPVGCDARIGLLLVSNSFSDLMCNAEVNKLDVGIQRVERFVTRFCASHPLFDTCSYLIITFFLSFLFVVVRAILSFTPPS